MENVVKIFKLNRPHGLKGQVKAQLLLPTFKVTQLIDKIGFVYTNNFYNPVTITQISLSTKFYLISFKEITTIEQAEMLTNNFLYVNKDEIKEMTKLISSDLINYYVYYQDKKIGEVVDLFSTKAHLIIIIKLLKSDKQMLIPYVEEYIDTVDDQTQMIILKKVIT